MGETLEMVFPEPADLDGAARIVHAMLGWAGTLREHWRMPRSLSQRLGWRHRCGPWTAGIPDRSLGWGCGVRPDGWLVQRQLGPDRVRLGQGPPRVGRNPPA